MKKKFLFTFTLLLMFFIFSGFTYIDHVKKSVVDYTQPETTEVTTESAETQSSTETQPFTEDVFSPDEGNTEILNGTIGEEYILSDELLPTNVSGEKFFAKIYRKTLGAVSGFQKILAIVFVLFFIVAALMTLVSCFGSNKSRIPWYILTMVIALILLVCDLYAFPIANSFINWWND